MSADNWTTCPQCAASHEATIEAAERKLESSYGRVEAQAFLLATKALEEMRGRKLDTTMREDYHVGIRDGEFTAEYTASCRNCGFQWEYKHSEAPTVVPTADTSTAKSVAKRHR
jgi:hypothetical protein